MIRIRNVIKNDKKKVFINIRFFIDRDTITIYNIKINYNNKMLFEINIFKFIYIFDKKKFNKALFE